MIAAADDLTSIDFDALNGVILSVVHSLQTGKHYRQLQI